VYSHKARMKAVRLYIRYHRSAAATVRELGYPCGYTLRTWYREFVKFGELHQNRPSKYSEEQKERAVEHYLKHGCSISQAAAELGYPPATLRIWIKELRPATRSVCSRRRSAVSLTEEQKRRAVIELCSREGSAAAVAKDVGASESSLYTWKKKLLGKEVPRAMPKKSGHPSSEDRDELLREVESLRKRIHQLQLEHDILKKANELLKRPC